MGVELFKKYVSSSMIICYRSVRRHPFLVFMVFLLIWMHRMFPLFFSFLVSSSPVIVSTAVLLGTLLSYGQPNIPEIETKPKSERYEIQKLESKVMSQTEIIGRDGNFASDETNGSRIEVVDRSFEVEKPVHDDNSHVEVDKPLYLVDDGEFVTEENGESSQIGEEHFVEEPKNETDEVKVVLGSHYTPLKQSDDEHVVLESDDKLWEGSADPLNSDPALLWKRVEGDGYDDDEDDDDDDGSDSDLAESSSPDASMADIIPLLDELHPLLSEEHEIRQEHHHDDGIEQNHEDSEHSLESSDSSSESDNEDDVKLKTQENSEAEDEENKEDKHTDKEDESTSAITWTEDDQKNLMNLGTSEIERNRHLENLIARRMAQKNNENSESGDEEHEEEDKEDKHTDKEDEPKSAITWTEDDQKNLMNLGTSELERNRRLENLIARRRARNTMRMQAEKNLIDLDTADFPWNNIPPISTARSNPFDYDANDNIPGSAPSVMLKRRNPFDLPYDSSEEKPDLVGDTFNQEFLGFQPKEPFFRRHESFNVGPSNFGGLRNEKLRPYFVPERIFQRQFSGISDSNKSVPDTESVSSDGDLENKDHIEDEVSLVPEIGSEKDEELTSERPYFVPEHVDSVTYERQLSDSKLSSIHDTESVSSVSDLESKDHVEEDHSLKPEVGSEKDEENEELTSDNHERPYFVPENVDSVTFERQSSEVSDSKESVSSDDDDVEKNDHIDLTQEPALISFEDDDENVESIQMQEENERHDEGEINVENIANQEIQLNLDDEEIHSSGSSSSNEVSEQVYNEKEEGDEVATTSVSETSYYFEDHGSNSNIIERSEIDDVMSLSLEVSQPKEPVYDMSPRSVTRNLSSYSICDDLKEDESETVQTLPTSEETVEKVEMESRSITDHDLNEDNQHKDESFQHSDNQHESLSCEEVVLDMNASEEIEKQVEVPSSSVNGDSHESSHHEEVISVAEDVEQVQVQEVECEEISEPQFTDVVHEETYENPDPTPTHQQFVSEEEEEATSQQQKENLESLQIQEPRDEISLNIDSDLNDEPEVVGSEDIDDAIDEELLVELDAVGDFSFSDLVSTLNDLEIEEEDVVETKHSGNEDSLNEKKEDIETKPYADEEEDSHSKEFGETFDEKKPDPHHDIESKLSGDEEDSYSEAIGSHLNDEMKHNPNDLLKETEGGHNSLETFYSVDEYAFSKIVESTLNEMKYEPQGLEDVLETNPSGDEDSLKTQLKMEEEEVMDSKNENESNNKEVESGYEAEEIKTKLMNHTNEVELLQETESNSNSATINESSTSNTDKE